MLSSQLISKPSHFILELTQNADDNNDAAAVEPALTLVYCEDGVLQITLNGSAFAEGSVSAVCEVADGTKNSIGSLKGYISEKGTGFNSVFTVADMVCST